MLKKVITFCLAMLLVTPAQADSFNVNLGDNSVRFLYATEMFGGTYGPIDFEVGLYFNEDDDVMGHMGFMVRNDTLDNPLVISLGTRLYYADAGNAPSQTQADVGAIAIGGELLIIPDNLSGLGFGFYYYTAPSVVSFMDADRFTEYGVSLKYEITQQSSISIGYQKVEADLDNGSTVEIEDGAYFSIGLRF